MADRQLRLRETDSGIEVAIHVQARAHTCRIVGLHDGALKLKVTAPPIDQAANRAVIEYFASLLGVPKSRLQLASGEKSRAKVLRIEGMNARRFLDRISGEISQ